MHVISTRRTLATCFGFAILTFITICILARMPLTYMLSFPLPTSIMLLFSWYSIDYGFAEAYWVERSNATEEEKKKLSNACYILFVVALGVTIFGYLMSLFYISQNLQYQGESISPTEEWYYVRDLVYSGFMAYSIIIFSVIPIIITHFAHKALISNFWIRVGYRRGR